MRLPGPAVVVAMALAAILFMAGVWVVSQGLRQEYHVLSKGDTERTQLDLTAERALWVELRPPGAAVLWSDLATRQRATLEPRNASLDQPVALGEGFAAWVEGGGPRRVRVHDFATGATRTLGAPGDNLTLPGRTLEGATLVVAGTSGGVAGLWRVALPGVELEPLLGGPLDVPMRLAAGRLWWADGEQVRGVDVRTGVDAARIAAGAPVLEVDAAGELVVWSEDQGRVRRVLWSHLGNGSRGDASAVGGDQHGPATDGRRVIFVQGDGLVRMVDLAAGGERVLPARTDENIRLRLAPGWAAWLSGTIDGHNVLAVPLRGALPAG